MINKDDFYRKHKDLPKDSLIKIIEVTAKELPRKVHIMKMHVRTKNLYEIGYYADFISDSYAFIFCDQELIGLCEEIVLASKQQKTDEAVQLYDKLLKDMDRFLEELNDLKAELSKE